MSGGVGPSAHHHEPPLAPIQAWQFWYGGVQAATTFPALLMLHVTVGHGSPYQNVTLLCAIGGATSSTVFELAQPGLTAQWPYHWPG
jgi:hypothetical protein